MIQEIVIMYTYFSVIKDYEIRKLAIKYSFILALRSTKLELV